MMRPAFSSTRQAAAFALLLLVVLLSPVLAGKFLLPPKEQSYARQRWEFSPYPWIRSQLFEETNDIDIVFMGSSLMLFGIDTPYVQTELSQKLQRLAVVRTIAWGGPGNDALYFIAKDLLQHRKVRLLIFSDENVLRKADRNPQATTWFRFGEDFESLAGLPVTEKAHYYFASLMGLPRNLLGKVSPIMPARLISETPNYMETAYQTTNPAVRLGSISSQSGCSIDEEAGASFSKFTPSVAGVVSNVVSYSTTTRQQFQFLNQALPTWQTHFGRKFAALAAAHGTRLALLHIPQVNEMRSPTILERGFWPDVLGANIAMIGIQPDKLFGGLTDAEVYKLYFNSGMKGFPRAAHFNQNGQKFFTSAITPELFRIYENAATP